MNKPSLNAKLNGQDLYVSYKLVTDKSTNDKFFTIFAKDNTYEVKVLNPLKSRG